MRTIIKQRILYIVADFFSVAISWFIFNIIRYYTISFNGEVVSLGEFLLYPQVITGQVVIPICMIGIFALSGYYNLPLYRSRVDETVNTFFTTLIGMLGIYFAVLVNDNIDERLKNYELMLILWGSMFFLTYLVRSIITLKTKHRIEQGALAFNTLIVGLNQDSQQLQKRLKDDIWYNVIGFVNSSKDLKISSRNNTLNQLPVYTPEKMVEMVLEGRVQRIIISPSDLNTGELTELINALFPLECEIFITPDTYQLITTRARFEDVTGEPLINISQPAMSPLTLNLKRAADVILSAIAMVALTPVYCVIAIAIKRDSKGPVLYRQSRIGYHKKPFKILKFRSMRTDAEKDGPQLSSQEDTRVTKVGKFLRKYRLDELPQFWNVFVGDMSIVGPRPEREYYVEQIVKRAPYYSLIHRLRPGITSWGMVRYGYAQNVDEMIQRLRYDLLYLENVSMALDMKILFHTVNTVIKGRGM